MIWNYRCTPKPIFVGFHGSKWLSRVPWFKIVDSMENIFILEPWDPEHSSLRKKHQLTTATSQHNPSVNQPSGGFLKWWVDTQQTHGFFPVFPTKMTILGWSLGGTTRWCYHGNPESPPLPPVGSDESSCTVGSARLGGKHLVGLCRSIQPLNEGGGNSHIF